MNDGLRVVPIRGGVAARMVIRHHYLHRRPPISFAYGLADGERLAGCVTFGVPPSRHLQLSACPPAPDCVLELNRLWVEDDQPRNTETWLIARALRALPPRLVVSYADPLHGHIGYVYRAANFHYAGWTDMERKTPRFDYLPETATAHSRDAFRSGWTGQRRMRVPKVRYWIATGNRSERRALEASCGWARLSWIDSPPPVPGQGAA